MLFQDDASSEATSSYSLTSSSLMSRDTDACSIKSNTSILDEFTPGQEMMSETVVV